MKSKKFFYGTSILLAFITLCTFLFINYTTPAVAEKTVAVGVVDVEKIMSEWPKFQTYSTELKEEGYAYAVLLDKASSTLTDVEKSEMQYRISKIMEHSNIILMEVLTREMRDAAEKVAAEKQLDVVLIKQRVHNSGTDITEDVMKLLKK